MSLHLSVGYHHNHSGEPDYRRHWLLFLAPDRGSKIGTAYDVLDPNENGIWELRERENFDLSASAFYQDKVPLGPVASDKESLFEEILKNTSLPTKTEDCQDWVKKAIEDLIKGDVLPPRARINLAMVPSS